MEAGISPQPAGQPQPLARIPKTCCEVAGGKWAAAIHGTAKDQSGEHGYRSLGVGVLLKLLQAQRFGLDVFGAVGLGFRQQGQAAVQDAGGGEVDDLLEPLGVEPAQQFLDGHHIDLMGPLWITPGRGRVNHSGNGGQNRSVLLLLA